MLLATYACAAMYTERGDVCGWAPTAAAAALARNYFSLAGEAFCFAAATRESRRYIAVAAAAAATAPRYIFHGVRSFRLPRFTDNLYGIRLWSDYFFEEVFFKFTFLSHFSFCVLLFL